MAVKIRLTRMGAKGKPFYRIVAADKEYPRDGRFLEILGNYDPKKNPAEISLKEDRVRDWLSKGASNGFSFAENQRHRGRRQVVICCCGILRYEIKNLPHIIITLNKTCEY